VSFLHNQNHTQRGMPGIMAAHPVSITPRRYIATVEGGASVAHTAYIGWTKPARVSLASKSPMANNRQKSDLSATAVCGKLTQPKLTVAMPTHDYKTSLHLPKENVMQGGTSLTFFSPTVVKMDRSFRNTFEGAHQSPYASPRATRRGVEGDSPSRRPIPRHFTDLKTLVISPGGQSQTLLVNAHETAWLGDESPPRIQLHASSVQSPRMQRLIDMHPTIRLDRTPSRLPCSLQHQPATLGPYKTDIVPYNPEYLWVDTDPEYKFRATRNKKRHGQPPVIASLRHEKEWARDNLAVSRDFYTRQMGIPKVGKLECTQNGYFDPNLISTARAELLFKERELSKKVGMDRLMEAARSEFATFKVCSFVLFVPQGFILSLEVSLSTILSKSGGFAPLY